MDYTGNKPTTIPNQETIEDLENLPKTKLPIAYVMWLTIRSKFVDALIEGKVIDESNWKEFEQTEIEKMQEEFKKLN